MESEPLTPKQLAEELGTEGLTVRNILRREFPRSSAEYRTKWVITPEQAAVVRREIKDKS